MSLSGDYLTGFVKPIFKTFVKGGYLEVLEQDFPLFTIGDGHGPHFAIEVDSPMTLWKIFRDPDFNLGETYVNYGWDMADGDLGEMLSWLCRGYYKMILGMRPPETSANDAAVSRRNVAHHYDLGNDLYECFLDEGLNYSCAFFDDHRMTLRDAQLNKLYTTIERADIRPGMKVLDIGSGWGELCRTIARAVPGADVTGLTLSENQIARAKEKNVVLDGNAPRFLMTDYRQHAAENPGTYDRIVSVGMFEHVGRDHYEDYFCAIHTMLKPGGKAVVHSIMRPDPGLGTSRWLEAYIFPGGNIPYLPDALEAADAQGLVTLRHPYIHHGHNYAETLRRWRYNFNVNANQLDPERYDERFKRIWNFYLAGCEAAFDGMGFYVAQMVFAKPL